MLFVVRKILSDKNTKLKKEQRTMKKVIENIDKKRMSKTVFKNVTRMMWKKEKKTRAKSKKNEFVNRKIFEAGTLDVNREKIQKIKKIG